MIRRPLSRNRRHSNRRAPLAQGWGVAGWRCPRANGCSRSSLERCRVGTPVLISCMAKTYRALRFRDVLSAKNFRLKFAALTRTMFEHSAPADALAFPELHMRVSRESRANMLVVATYYSKSISQRCITDRAKSLG